MSSVLTGLSLDARFMLSICWLTFLVGVLRLVGIGKARWVFTLRLLLCARAKKHSGR